MGNFLNSRGPYEEYKRIAGTRFFVDKSALIEELLVSVMEDGQRYFCITRPRRFGKSVMANMIGAFLGRAESSDEIFGRLKIGESDWYKEHLNRHEVIYIDFSRLPENCSSYETYIRRISDGILADLLQRYPQGKLDTAGAVWDNLKILFEQENAKFVFVMDEWDAIFHKDFISEGDKKRFLEFLRDLLKGQPYVELAYMTGVLPIAKYASGSELNMFLEYDMATREKFSQYFGFLDSEVDRLFEIYRGTEKNPKITREDLEEWYDGYRTAAGHRLYNPRSVIGALANNQISNYWTSSGPYDEIFYYIRNNIEGVRDDLVRMVSGEPVEIKLQGVCCCFQGAEYEKSDFFGDGGLWTADLRGWGGIHSQPGADGQI